MGVNLSQCSGSHTELDQVREAKCSPADIVESITDTSSEDESANSSRPVQISPNHDENRPESCPMETPQSEEFRIRSDSMESETSPDILKSIDISDLSVSYAMNELLRYCESGNCGAVRLLLGRYNELLEMLNDYHDCHIGDREMNITPLMLAAACGHADLVDLLLLTPSVLINAKSNDGHGQTALHIAVSLGQLKCVQVLVNNSKVDVNALDSLEMTPLHGATSGHFDGAIELLLQRNDINCGLQDSNGNNILHIGAISTNVQAVKSIIQHASMTDYNEICRYEDQSVARNAIPMRRPMIGGSLKSLTDALNNDGLDVKTILKDNIAALKSSSMTCQRTADYLEICDDAHRCLVLYTRATSYPSTLLKEGDLAFPAEEHSPQEDITIALSWSPKAIQSKNGSFIKVCSPLSH